MANEKRNIQDYLDSGEADNADIDGPLAGSILRLTDPTDTTEEGEWQIHRAANGDLIFSRVENGLPTEHQTIANSIATDRVHLSKDITLSAAGHHIKVTSGALPELTALVTQVPYDVTGTLGAVTPILGPVQHIGSQPTETDHWVGKSIGMMQSFGESLLIRKFYMRGGSVPATNWVVLDVHLGHTVAGPLLYQKKIHPDVLVNGYFDVDTEDSLGIAEGSSVYFHWYSEEDFSLWTASGTHPYFKIDKMSGKHENLAYSPSWESKDYVRGDSVIEGGAKWSCHTAGWQYTDWETNKATYWQLGDTDTSMDWAPGTWQQGDMCKVNGLLYTCHTASFQNTEFEGHNKDNYWNLGYELRKPWISGNSYLRGQRRIVEGFPYVCKEDGTQSGTWGENSLKWDRGERIKDSVTHRKINTYTQLSCKCGGMEFSLSEDNLSATNVLRMRRDQNVAVKSAAGFTCISQRFPATMVAENINAGNPASFSEDWVNVAGAHTAAYQKCTYEMHLRSTGYEGHWSIVTMIDGNTGVSITVDYIGNLWDYVN